jgi:hypothetical protein
MSAREVSFGTSLVTDCNDDVRELLVRLLSARASGVLSRCA